MSSVSFEARVSKVKVSLIDGKVKATSGKGWHVLKKAKMGPYVGEYYCTCMAWKMGKDRWCKHLEAAAREGLIQRPVRSDVCS